MEESVPIKSEPIEIEINPESINTGNSPEQIDEHFKHEDRYIDKEEYQWQNIDGHSSQVSPQNVYEPKNSYPSSLDVNECSANISLNIVPGSLLRNQIDNNVQKSINSVQANRIPCTECEKTFKTQDGANKHIKYVHGENQTVECKECLKTFKSIIYLRSHTRAVHAKTEYVKCPHCEKVCATQKKLADHIYCAHRKPEDRVDCTICGKSFKSRYHLKLHVKYLHVDGQKHTCQFCGKSFKVDMLLQRHIKWSHPGDGMIYKCHTCNKVLSSFDGYRNHLKSVHFYDQVTCDMCKRTFKTKKTLERHIRNIHFSRPNIKTEIYTPKDYKCQFCERTFVNCSSLYWHIDRFHSGNHISHTLCIVCNKELSDYAALHRHLQSVHSIETATCKICFKEFKSAINLQNHIRITHAPPEAVQTCEACQKTFKCALHLRMHMLSVHDGGTYTCQICQKTFTSNKYLTKHIKSHDETREYKCEVCSKMFKNTNAVNKHKKLVHDRVKCHICHIKHKDIEEHMRIDHPGMQYEPHMFVNVQNDKPKRKRNRKVNSNLVKRPMPSSEHTHADNIQSIESKVYMKTENTINDTENSQENIIPNKDIKVELEEMMQCEICKQSFDSYELSQHSMSCREVPILEVTIKTEIKEEIA